MYCCDSKNGLAGFLLIAVSILLGHLIEKAYNKYSGCIRSWTSLIAFFCVLYLAIFGSMYYLGKNADDEQVIGPFRILGF